VDYRSIVKEEMCFEWNTPRFLMFLTSLCVNATLKKKLRERDNFVEGT